MKQIYFLITILFFLTINLNAQQTYNATSPALNTPVNNFAMHFPTGTIPVNSTVTLSITVTANTSNDNRDIIWLGTDGKLTGLGNAYPIHNPSSPVTVDYDISSEASGHDLSTEEILYSGNAWNTNIRKDFVYGSLTFSSIKLTVTPITLTITDNFQENINLSISPNPSSDFISVSNLKSTESYLIINQIGQEVKRGIISNQEKINIGNFSNGLYFLKFENGNTVKFIKE